jgi:hypothetical protein
MLSDLLMWNKIGRIITLLAKHLNVKPERAFDIFYLSETNQRLHDAEDYLFMMSDRYIVDELILELQGKMS